MWHSQKAAADDFARISCRVEGQRSQGAPIRLAHKTPQPQLLQRRAELAEAVVDQKDLDQERRAAKDEHIDAGEPTQDSDRRHPHRRQQQRQHRAERDRA